MASNEKELYEEMVFGILLFHISTTVEFYLKLKYNTTTLIFIKLIVVGWPSL
jgi:hypothetical protein